MEMDGNMSQKTREEVLAGYRRRYRVAGKKERQGMLDEVVSLLGYHRKSAIRALGAKAGADGGKTVLGARIRGRPREYQAGELLPVLKPIWFGALQPSGDRLAALLPDWVAAYEEDHRRLDGGLREQLLEVSGRTLDRLLEPLRVGLRRRGGTRPGSLLRQSIPVRGRWEEDEQGPGWLEVDTVALCGGSMEGSHVWMLDGVDIRTHWVELRALENRGELATVRQLKDLEERLPFRLKGVDCDNGGEFLNHSVKKLLLERVEPVRFTRSRPYRKNDQAHVEQRNWTHVRQHFGYERYDNPEVVPLLNRLCTGALGQLHNLFLPTEKLKAKRIEGKRVTRVYEAPRTPLARVLEAEEVSEESRERLKKLKAGLNPFQLGRDIEKAKREIEQRRVLRA